MDRQIGRGINAAGVIAHSGLIILWTVLSVILYGLTVLSLSVFSRRAARFIARQWCLHLIFIAGVKLRVEGIGNIDKSKNYVFMANHQGYFDIPMLFAVLGSTLSFIAKKELFRIPFFGWGMWAIGCITMDRQNPRKARESITRAVSALKKNNISLVIFPEGTRSASGKVGEFKRASFTLALEAGVPVVPVAICGTRNIQNKESFLIFPATVRLAICAPLALTGTPNIDKGQLAGKVRETIIKAMEEKIAG